MSKIAKGALHGGLTLAAVGLVVLLIVTCGGDGALEFPARTVRPLDPATTGTVRGTVVFKKTPPRNPPINLAPECRALANAPAFDPVYEIAGGRVRNAAVRLKSGVDDSLFDWSREERRITNSGCLYQPRVSAVMVYQPVRLANDDPTLHNIRIFGPSGRSLSNQSIPNVGGSYLFQFKTPGLHTLQCDVHSSMVGYVWAAGHPLVQVTGAEGTFELKNVPQGEYEIEAWHERFKPAVARITVEAGKALSLELELTE